MKFLGWSIFLITWSVFHILLFVIFGYGNFLYFFKLFKFPGSFQSYFDHFKQSALLMRPCFIKPIIKVSFMLIVFILPLFVLLIGFPCFTFSYIFSLDYLTNFSPSLFSYAFLNSRVLRRSVHLLITTLSLMAPCLMTFNMNVFLWHLNYYTSNH